MAAQDSVLVQIARPYAVALYDLAKGDSSIDEVETGLAAIAKIADESPDFHRFLRSPVINAEVKATTIDAVLDQAKAHPTVAKFVKLVARNGRLFALPTIIESFAALAAQGRGEVAADVTSAAPLSASQLSDLAETLKRKIGKTVTLNQHVDPSLIGGLMVKVGSRMIDSSLKTKLAAMKIAMKEVG